LKKFAIATLLLHQAIAPASAQSFSPQNKISLGVLAAGAAALLLGSKNAYAGSTTGAFTLPGERPGANIVTGKGPLQPGGAAGVAGATSGYYSGEDSIFLEAYDLSGIPSVFDVVTITTTTSSGH
jgi:hypothetical protein